MKNHPMIRIFILGLAALVGSAALPVLLAAGEERIEKAFDVSAGGKLVMEVDRGSIDVKTVPEANTLRIEVLRRLDRLSQAQAEEVFRDHEIEFVQEGNLVRVQSKFKGDTGRIWNRRGRNLQVRYLVTAPKKFEVELKTAGGSISVSDLEGKVQARTSGGSLNFGQIQGPVWGRTSGGSIILKGCAADVDVESSGGSLKIGEVTGNVQARTSGGSIQIRKSTGNVIAKTSGGGIEVEEVLGTIEASTSGGSVRALMSQQPEGPCTLKTSGGSIEVKLAEKVSVDLDAKTSGGRVITDFPVMVQGPLKQTSLKSKINGGGPALILETSGGNVHIRKL